MVVNLDEYFGAHRRKAIRDRRNKVVVRVLAILFVALVAWILVVTK